MLLLHRGVHRDAEGAGRGAGGIREPTSGHADEPAGLLLPTVLRQGLEAGLGPGAGPLRTTHPYGGTRYGEGIRGLTDAVRDVESWVEDAAGRSSTVMHHAVFLSDGKPGDHMAERVLAELQTHVA